ncbi:hemin ABC transporter substrate-binding protein [Paracoccus sp. P2]|uniref:ABC transporter substrate-binding protein n=1 Tax=Paracoccus pantotrophus TaxID=82367 RepID=A0A7H9BQ34_PARPN|nr:ABC transporter substrate-binding protein [Paracoccus pantotrophus]MDF3855174.1 ABC transporter substrate-binding protein [Paracoccus pantotrophus]QLH13447.1 ABC transporter substrate-binding protein [Paracoccus pantotrophus]RDD96711.1 hemin ABC transporter substrate-binding protein [Paracoccus pantotrophus]RNI16989.1 hemin ABC transporter substrate-binding protein [Paracoccus pantotrophus]WGR67337.1 hemin ABC transporter substrate-binding protein [Paracoccus pantotrophus]
MKRLALALVLLAGQAAAEDQPEAQRVLSLGGSVTEIVYALGEEARLIGRDTTSNWPPEANALPDVGYVRALSPEGVLSVAPDLIIAEDGAGPPEAVAVLQSAGVAFVSVAERYDAEGVLDKVDAVAEALGVPDKGRALHDKLAAELQAALGRAQAVGEPKKVLFVLSLQGGRVMAGGADTAADGIIRLAGAQNAMPGVQGYKPVTDEAVIAAAPDVILMMRRGDEQADADANGGSSHTAAKQAVLAMPALAQTPAGRAGAVVMMDGLKLLGFGPRTGEAAVELHDLIYAGS